MSTVLYFKRLTKNKRNCILCQVEYQPTNNGQKYCTLKCQEALYVKKYSRGKTLWARKWRKENPKTHLDRIMKYTRLNPEKKKARSIVEMGINSGRLIRPSVCSNCFNEGRIDAHHPDYSKPLEVIWLCRSCHIKLHKAKC